MDYSEVLKEFKANLGIEDEDCQSEEEINEPTLNEKEISEPYTYKDNNIDKDLFCSICLDVLFNPVMHKECLNMFCEKCVRKLKSCPICRKDVDGCESFENSIPLYVTNKLDSLSVICSYCNTDMKREDIVRHIGMLCKKSLSSELFVNNSLEGKTFMIKVNIKKTPIGRIKEIIGKVINNSPEDFRLMWAGRQLYYNDKTCSDYGIYPEATLIIFKSLKGD